MQKLKNVQFNGIKYFKCKKYFKIFHKIFNNIGIETKYKTLYEVLNKKINDDNIIISNNISRKEEKNIINNWQKLKNSIDKIIYLDFSCNLLPSKFGSEYTMSYLAYKYIKKFCQENFNKLKNISKIHKIKVQTLKTLYLNICMKYCDNKNLPSKNKLNIELKKVISKESNKTNMNNKNKIKIRNRSSLYITDNFSSIICKKENFIQKKQRAIIYEKYNAIKNQENEIEEDNEKLEINYLIKNQLPIGHITNKFIGPTDENSIMNKHRKLLIDFKLRENAIIHSRNKSNHEKISKSLTKIKYNNHLNFPSLKFSNSSNSFGKNIMINTARTFKTNDNYFKEIPRLLSEKNKKKKILHIKKESKSPSKININYFSKMDMFY